MSLYYKRDNLNLLILEPKMQGKTKEEGRVLRKSEGCLKKRKDDWGKRHGAILSWNVHD